MMVGSTYLQTKTLARTFTQPHSQTRSCKHASTVNTTADFSDVVTTLSQCEWTGELLGINE